MLNRWIRERAQTFLNFIALGLGAAGFSPNALTFIGFIAMCGIGVVLAFGNFALGGILILLAGIFDSLDGSLARLTNHATKFGAYLDSTTDRFAEGALFLGILYAYLQRGVTFVAYLVVFALLGSLMVSYARARAEGIGVECAGGLLTRFERVAILVLGLILTAFWGDLPLFIALALIAIFANVTAVQRIWLVYRATRD
jgi:CDP-diacylglycerol--glycerol-3-phosphate 3-phosphatidyltransferase